MYAHHDCSLTAPNLYEKVVHLVCKLSFPVNGVLLLTHELAFECLLALVLALSRQNKMISPPVGRGEAVRLGAVRRGSATDVTAQQLSAAKALKRKLTAACEAFNHERKLSKALSLLQARGTVAAVSASDAGVPASDAGVPASDAGVLASDTRAREAEEASLMRGIVLQEGGGGGGAEEELAWFFRRGMCVCPMHLCVRVCVGAAHKLSCVSALVCSAVSDV